MTSRDDGFHRFLVKWHGRPDFDATWIQEDDLRHLDHLLLDCYLSFHSSESSSFQHGGNDGAWSKPISRPKRDKKPKSNDEFLLLLVIYLIVFLDLSISTFGFIC